MEPDSHKITLGGKHLKSRNITSSAREMSLPGNKSKVKPRIQSQKKPNSNVTLEVIWKLAQVNTEQASWKTAANCQRVDSISHLINVLLQGTPLRCVHIWPLYEKATSYTSGITILLQSAGPQSFLSKDSVLLWQENLTDEYYQAWWTKRGCSLCNKKPILYY